MLFRSEMCSGTDDVIAADVFALSSVEARAATTACDVAEMCSGTDDVIAADVFALSSVEARAATTACCNDRPGLLGCATVLFVC